MEDKKQVVRIVPHLGVALKLFFGLMGKNVPQIDLEISKTGIRMNQNQIQNEKGGGSTKSPNTPTEIVLYQLVMGRDKCKNYEFNSEKSRIFRIPIKTFLDCVGNIRRKDSLEIIIYSSKRNGKVYSLKTIVRAGGNGPPEEHTILISRVYSESSGPLSRNEIVWDEVPIDDYAPESVSLESSYINSMRKSLKGKTTVYISYQVNPERGSGYMEISTSSDDNDLGSTFKSSSEEGLDKNKNFTKLAFDASILSKIFGGLGSFGGPVSFYFEKEFSVPMKIKAETEIGCITIYFKDKNMIQNEHLNSIAEQVEEEEEVKPTPKKSVAKKSTAKKAPVQEVPPPEIPAAPVKVAKTAKVAKVAKTVKVAKVAKTTTKKATLKKTTK